MRDDLSVACTTKKCPDEEDGLAAMRGLANGLLVAVPVWLLIFDLGLYILRC